MADTAADEGAPVSASLAGKYRTFLEGLTDEEFTLYGVSVGAGEDAETAGFASVEGVDRLMAKVAGTSLGSVFQDITVNKAKTADKAAAQMDAYIKQ